jgi:hypothetical protein
MTKHAITIEIDTDGLRNLEDSRLAALWHVAQANPAPYHDRNAGELADEIGREIIRRWLAHAPSELYSHTAASHYTEILRRHGSWPGPKHDVWVYEPGKAERGADDANVVDAEVHHG